MEWILIINIIMLIKWNKCKRQAWWHAICYFAFLTSRYHNLFKLVWIDKMGNWFYSFIVFFFFSSHTGRSSGRFASMLNQWEGGKEGEGRKKPREGSINRLTRHASSPMISIFMRAFLCDLVDPWIDWFGDTSMVHFELDV